jgi:hypothetical protein
MNVLTLITTLRRTDPYVRTIFSEGSCYKFFLFLKAHYPDAIPVINAKEDHIGSLINGEVYDIDGVADWSFRAMDDRDISIAEKWSFSGNSFLQVGECPICEEPILR